MPIPEPLIATPEYLDVLDGRCMPDAVKYLRFKSVYPLAQALRECLIFGPGLIPPTIAHAMAMEARSHLRVSSMEGFYYALQEALFSLRAARPESRPVNFSVDVLSTLVRHIVDTQADKTTSLQILEENMRIAYERITRTDNRISQTIAELLPQNARVMVIGGCGGMSSVGIGTGVAGLISAHRAGKSVNAVTPYSMPLCSGPKLIAYELQSAGINCEIISDTSVGAALMTEKFDAIITISNRVCTNGDTSCPSGSNNAACVAKYAGVPFYVITYDHVADIGTPSLDTIPLEEFRTSEPQHGALANTRQYVNDLVATEWITGYITRQGIYRPRSEEALGNLVNNLHQSAQGWIGEFLAKF